MKQEFQLAPDVFFDETIEGIYILCSTGEVYVISDDVGKEVWSLIVKGVSEFSEISNNIRNLFTIEETDTIDTDLEEFFSVLGKIGAIELCQSTPTTTS